MQGAKIRPESPWPRLIAMKRSATDAVPDSINIISSLLLRWPSTRRRASSTNIINIICVVVTHGQQLPCQRTTSTWMETIDAAVKIMEGGSRQGTHTAMVITMKDTSWPRGVTFATATASSTALTKEKRQIMSTMANGSITCAKERVTVTTIMRTYTLAHGRPTNVMASVNSSHINKTDTKVSGGMICGMVRETRHRRMARRMLEPGAKIRNMARGR